MESEDKYNIIPNWILVNYFGQSQPKYKTKYQWLHNKMTCRRIFII